MGSKMKTAKIIARLTNQIYVFSVVLYVSCTGNVLMDLMVEKEILLFYETLMMILDDFITIVPKLLKFLHCQ